MPRSEKAASFVERMTAAQKHRGPDGSGLWQSRDQEVVFGHRRLAIIDLSDAGAQPMVDASSGLVLTFNGEIYNFLEIRRELEAGGVSFRSASDTEVLLKAYDRWGLDAVRRFRGIFAFALWDPRQRVVHLVRDPMGIKPLYWTVCRDPDTGGELLLFSSELRAMLASGAVPRRLDPAAVASYLWHGFVVGPGTAVEGVRLLPAGSILSVPVDAAAPGAELPAPSGYWSPRAAPATKTSPDELRDELWSTVRMQLVSDVPLGVFLSGGVDSSAVARIASAVAPDSIHTFTIGFELEAYDEARYARQVAEAIGSRHTTTVLREQDFAEQLPAAFAAFDQPTFDGINTYFVSRAAREAGMTVALAGTGGDELFGGYPSFVDMPKAMRAGAWIPFVGHGDAAGRAASSAVGAAGRWLSSLFWDVLGVAPPQTRWGKLPDALCSLRDVLSLYQVSYALFTRASQASMSDARVAAAGRPSVDGLPPGVAQAWRASIAGAEPRQAVSVLELKSFVGERLLRDSDAASMAVALELRVPLLDHVLVERVAGVDPEGRFSPPGRKRLLRELALAGLDASIFERPKSGFVLPIDAWARKALRRTMDEAFSDPELARSVGLRPEPLRVLWRSFQDGRPGLYWTRPWALYVLLWWCRTHDVRLDAA